MGFFKFLGKKKERAELPSLGLEVPLPPPSLKSSTFSSELPSFPGPPLREESLFSPEENPLFESEIPMPPQKAPLPPFSVPMPPAPQKRPEQQPMPELKPLEIPSFDMSQFSEDKNFSSSFERPLSELFGKSAESLQKPEAEKPLFSEIPAERKPQLFQRAPQAAPEKARHFAFVESENFKLILANLSQIQDRMQSCENVEKVVESKDRMWKSLRNDFDEIQRDLAHIEKSIFELN